jgi:recombination protein RecT
VTTAVAKRDAVAEVVAAIGRDDFQQQLKEVLPSSVSLERFTRTTKLAVQLNPEIVAADRKSLFLAMVRCAASGLLPDGRESALVVVKAKGVDKVQWWPMIGGLRKKAAEHGITLAAAVVYANDEFSYSTMPPAVTHTPTPLGQERGLPVGAFAAALAPDGRVICPPVVMTVDEIEQVRAASRAATSEYGPWVKWWTRMACKTAARRLFAEMPLAGEARDDLERVMVDVDDGRVEEASAPVPALANLPLPNDAWEPVDGEAYEDPPDTLPADEPPQGGGGQQADGGAPDVSPDGDAAAAAGEQSPFEGMVDKARRSRKAAPDQ